jgi:hemerythrin-like domain-containing protein
MSDRSVVTAEPKTQEMVVIHRIFRRGFPMLAEVIRRVPASPPGRSPARRVATIATHVEFMLNGLHHHHTAEDQHLWPRLLERAAPDAELIGRIADQHKAVDAHVEQARRLLPTWRAAPSVPASAELADTLDRLHEALAPHLDEEEAEILPLVRKHITEAEWVELGETAFAGFTNDEKLIALGQMLDVTTPTEAAIFLTKLPLPIRLMWRLVGRRKYTRYMATVRGTG